MPLQGTLGHTLITQVALATFNYVLIIKLKSIKYFIINMSSQFEHTRGTKPESRRN